MVGEVRCLAWWGYWCLELTLLAEALLAPSHHVAAVSKAAVQALFVRSSHCSESEQSANFTVASRQLAG